MMHSNRLGLKATLFIVILLFISLFIYAIFLYMDLNDKRTEGYEKTVIEILNQTSIKEVTHVEQFNGEKAYHVVHGVNEEDLQKIIFYPLEGEEKTLTTIDAEETISREEMRSMWASDCNDCEFVRLTPALIADDVLWELVYYDEKEQYVFDYRSIHDGTDVEKISYLRKFN